MKKLLLVFLLACGATAMANTTDPMQEKKAHVTHTVAKEATKTNVKADTSITKAEVNKQAAGTTSYICSDNTRYGLGAYIVDFISRNNVKIMRKLLID